LWTVSSSFRRYQEPNGILHGVFLQEGISSQGRHNKGEGASVMDFVGLINKMKTNVKVKIDTSTSADTRSKIRWPEEKHRGKGCKKQKRENGKQPRENNPNAEEPSQTWRDGEIADAHEPGKE
jgi:hypothetical protein